MKRIVCFCSDQSPNETININENDDQLLKIYCEGKKLWLNNSNISYRFDNDLFSIDEYPQLILDHRPRLYDRPYYSLFQYPKLIEKNHDQFFDVLYVDMKITEDYSMPILSIPIRTKEFSSSYKSIYDIIQNEIGFEIFFEKVFLGPSEIKEGTIGDIIQKVKESTSKITVNCQLTENSIDVINKRISVVNQIIEFESKYLSELTDQSAQSEKKTNYHMNFLNGLRNSFCGYASQVGWIFLNSFGINTDDYESKSSIINQLVEIIPTEMKELFESLLHLTPLCHPDNFFIEQSIKILSRLNSPRKRRNKKKSKKNLIEEEEEEADSNDEKKLIGNDDDIFTDSQENILMQNIDDYSMSTDEFVNTVEHILGQKDDIKISKNYDDENRNRKRIKQNPLNIGSIDFNYNQNKNLNENKENEKSNLNSKESDYSRFFLFAKNNNNNEDMTNIRQSKTFVFPSSTPKKNTNSLFISESKSSPINYFYPDFTDKKNKTPIKRSIKLDSSKKFAYTPEERRNKAKQISKFIKSSNNNQIDDFSPFSLFESPLPQKSDTTSQNENVTKKTVKNQKNKNKKKSVSFGLNDEDLSSLNQSTEIEFNVEDDDLHMNKKGNKRNYRDILSPRSQKIELSDDDNQNRKKYNKGRVKNVQFNTD